MRRPSARSKSRGVPNPPPLSLTRRWDKAKWHFDADDFPATLPRSSASRHILATLKFLDGQRQLTAEGKRELRDGASEETALLADHVRAAARGFLDATYDAYLESVRYGEAPPVKVLAAGWKAYAGRFDLSRRPVATPYETLLLEHAADDPTLDGLLDSVRWNPAILEQLAAARDFLPARDRLIVATLLDVETALREGDVGLTRVSAPPIARLEALGHLTHERVLEEAARIVAKAGDVPSDTMDAAIANVLLHRPRREWLALPTTHQKRMRESLHRLLGRDPHLAMCALQVAANAASVKLVEAIGTHPDEGTIETYRSRKGVMVVARVERGWDKLRRTIASVARAKR